ncbi:cupin-like domain-containing protein [Pseudomonas sp. CVAP|uniref:cupin-like domain-containing protein n=1 Tax=Pseudomonas sp. CVAP\|nr:cupin-like domain-containing protein [Pseudomonas sp. CVAP\
MKKPYMEVTRTDKHDFFKHPISAYKEPIIITDFSNDWTAQKLWSFDFFSNKYGDLPVKVYDDNFSKKGNLYLKHSKEMPFRQYLREIQGENGHLRLFLFELLKEAPELKSHIVLPDAFNALSHLNLFMFFGGISASPPTHYDIDLPHVFHTLFSGEKSVYLFDPVDSYHLHQHPFTVRSYVDPEKPDFQRFPRFKHANGWHCTLKKGDTLFIPIGFWHKIYYTSPSFSISHRLYESKPLIRGLYNLLILEKIDLLLNAIAPRTWLAWKAKKAGEMPT